MSGQPARNESGKNRRKEIVKDIILKMLYLFRQENRGIEKLTA
jgi:hypothetical protein